MNLKTRLQFVCKLQFVVGLFLFSLIINAQQLNRPPGSDEINYYPEECEVISTNPPLFMWLPVENAGSYFIQYSSTVSFDPDFTTEVSGLNSTVHIPTEVLKPGNWHYGYINGKKSISAKHVLL